LDYAAVQPAVSDTLLRRNYPTNIVAGLGYVLFPAVEPVVGMTVWKNGCTTGITSGIITRVSDDGSVCAVASMQPRHLLPFALPGDSGALVLTEEMIITFWVSSPKEMINTWRSIPTLH
jgi:hypothetical protein